MLEEPGGNTLFKGLQQAFTAEEGLEFFQIFGVAVPPVFKFKEAVGRARKRFFQESAAGVVPVKAEVAREVQLAEAERIPVESVAEFQDALIAFRRRFILFSDLFSGFDLLCHVHDDAVDDVAPVFLFHHLPAGLDVLDFPRGGDDPEVPRADVLSRRDGAADPLPRVRQVLGMDVERAFVVQAHGHALAGVAENGVIAVVAVEQRIILVGQRGEDAAVVQRAVERQLPGLDARLADANGVVGLARLVPEQPEGGSDWNVLAAEGQRHKIVFLAVVAGVEVAEHPSELVDGVVADMAFGDHRFGRVGIGPPGVAGFFGAEAPVFHFPRAEIHLPEHGGALIEGCAAAELGEFQVLFGLLELSDVRNDADQPPSRRAGSGKEGASNVAPLHGVVRPPYPVGVIQRRFSARGRAESVPQFRHILRQHGGEQLFSPFTDFLPAVAEGLENAGTGVGQRDQPCVVHVAHDHRARQIFQERTEVDRVGRLGAAGRGVSLLLGVAGEGVVVLTQRFRLVKSRVGFGVEVLQGLAALFVETDADAARQLQGAFSRPEVVLHGVDQAGGLARYVAPVVHVLHEGHELVAADPPHDVGVAEGLADCLGDTGDHVVAGLVTELVVHVLEVVDVDHEERVGSRGALLREEAADMPDRRVVVEKPRHGIAFRRA